MSRYFAWLLKPRFIRLSIIARFSCVTATSAFCATIFVLKRSRSASRCAFCARRVAICAASLARSARATRVLAGAHRRRDVVAPGDLRLRVHVGRARGGDLDHGALHLGAPVDELGRDDRAGRLRIDRIELDERRARCHGVAVARLDAHDLARLEGLDDLGAARRLDLAGRRRVHRDAAEPRPGTGRDQHRADRRHHQETDRRAGRIIDRQRAGMELAVAAAGAAFRIRAARRRKRRRRRRNELARRRRGVRRRRRPPHHGRAFGHGLRCHRLHATGRRAGARLARATARDVAPSRRIVVVVSIDHPPAPDVTRTGARSAATTDARRGRRAAAAAGRASRSRRSRRRPCR